MKKIFANKYFHFGIAIIAILMMTWVPNFFSPKKVNLEDFQSKLHKKEKLAIETLDEIIAHQSIEVLFSFSTKYAELCNNEGISFFILENDKTIFWTDRNVQFDNYLKKFKAPSGIVQLKNGWYQYLMKEKNRKTYLSLILIQNISPINNKYFSNSFHESFNVDAAADIVIEKTQMPLYNIENNYLFSIQELLDDVSFSKNNWWVLILVFVAFLMV